MKRLLAFIFSLLVFPAALQAAGAPPGQVHISDSEILRGHFAQERLIKGNARPLSSTGHFVIAPGHGLIWGMEKPLPTSTIITPDNMIQDLAGMAMKLPAKNLHHLYTVISSALAGDWSGLESDFSVTQSGDASHWQMLLMPRPNGNSKLDYATITVSGTKFVENIVMTKADGTYDMLTFTDQALSSAPLTTVENAYFIEASK